MNQLQVKSMVLLRRVNDVLPKSELRVEVSALVTELEERALHGPVRRSRSSASDLTPDLFDSPQPSMEPDSEPESIKPKPRGGRRRQK